MAGIVQLLAGVLKFGASIRMVPDTVMMGILNGVAINLVRSQLDHFRAVPIPGEHHAPWLTGERGVLPLRVVPQLLPPTKPNLSPHTLTLPVSLSHP